MFHPVTLPKFCSFGKQHFDAGLADDSEMAPHRNKTVNEVLAENIRAEMKRAKISSQPALAKLSGVAQTTISNYLNPNQRLTSKSGKAPSAKLTEVEQIAAALGVPVWKLLRSMTPKEREFYDRIERAYKQLLEDEGDDPSPEPEV